MSDFKASLNDIQSQFASLEGNLKTGSCWRLSTTMQDLDAALREHIQAVTKTEVEGIISKLQSNQELTPDEIELIKLWICGDADYYVKLENNYNDWVQELKRLVGEIAQAQGDNPDFKAASNLRARLLDAIRVLGDIVFFLKQKERIANFTESTKVIDPQEADLLVRLLQGKIISENE